MTLEAVDNEGRATVTIDGESSTAYLIKDHWYFGGNAKHAHSTLKRKRIGADTDAIKSYSVGKLPPAHLHARAKRYAVKLFLAHYHETGYRLRFGEEPPAPYPISHLGHTHRIPVPNPV